MTINRERIGAEYPVPDYEATAERIAAYAGATSAPDATHRIDGDVAPPVFAIVPAWPAVAAVLADESTGIEAGRTVHGEQRMRLHRPIRAGDILRSVGRLASVEERGANEVFVITLSTTDADGEPVADQDVVVVSRGTASGGTGTNERARPPAGEVPPEPPDPDATLTVELDAGITHAYASASGDDNRIHVEDDFARSVGLPGIIVQGMCLLSISLQAVTDGLAVDPASIREVGVRFARPIQPGQPFTTRAWRSEGGATFDARGPEGDVLRNGRVSFG
ncbi:MAG TPA: MaoC family dehydratase N-terminal domain-containing protein [Actinomycetota bacterium]|jgi:acyl dehydratase